MNHVFVSYSRKDNSFVDQLIRDLESNGIEVWIDREDIRGGDRWRPAIVEAIRACQTFLLVLSPNAVVSENVSKELSIAETHKRRIIPIAYQPCEIPAEMEYQLAELQWIDFSTISYQAALGQLSQVLGKPQEPKQQRPAGVLQPKASADKTPPTRLRLAALIGAAVVVIGVLAFLFSRFQTPSGGGNQTPTPTPTSTPAVPTPVQTISPPTYDRIKAVRLTAEGLDEDISSKGALVFFNEAIKTDPTYADAYFYRGQVFVALKNNARAIADFKKALELELEADQRKITNEFLAGLSVETGSGQAAGPSPSPTPVIPGSTPGTPLPRRSPTIGVIRPTLPRPVTSRQVSDMFNADKGVRIQATTRLIIDQKQNAEAVSMVIAEAQKQLNNKSGVINTLVYLENVPPAILRSKRKEVTEFLDAVRKTNPGTQTAEHIAKVKEALNKP